METTGKVEIKKELDISPAIIRRGNVLLDKNQEHFVTVCMIDDFLKTMTKFRYFEDRKIHFGDTKEFCYAVYELLDDGSYLVSEIKTKS